MPSLKFLRNVHSQIRAIFTNDTLTDFVRELDRYSGFIPQHFICAMSKDKLFLSFVLLCVYRVYLSSTKTSMVYHRASGIDWKLITQDIEVINVLYENSCRVIVQ